MLSTDQRSALDVDGFVHLQQYIDQASLIALRAICDDLSASGDGLVNLAKNLDVPEICPVARRPEVFRSELAEMPAWKKLLELGRSILGAEASLCNSAFFIKPP